MISAKVQRSSLFMVFVLVAMLVAWHASQPVSAVITVPAGGDLQAAINAAVPGDTIVLTSGATYTGNFVLPVTSGSTFITITSTANVPAEGMRIVPGTSLAKLQAPAGGQAALRTAPSAHHWKLVGLELLPNPGGFGDILDLGDGGPAQNTLLLVPHDLVVDRCYIHGDPVVGQKRGIGLNSASTSVMNSYISGMRAPGQDSQAIGGQNGPGPFAITNNYLEAASENVLFGGADPKIPGLLPSHILVQGNYFAKPLAWKGIVGWNVKNLFELKIGAYVTVEGNVFENSWADAQGGDGISLTVLDQDGTAPWSTVHDVEFRYNIVRNVEGYAVNMSGRDYHTGIGSVQGTNVSIHDNLFLNVARGFALQDGYQPTNLVHNTLTGVSYLALLFQRNPMPSGSLTFQNNVLPEGIYSIEGNGDTAIGMATLTAMAPMSVFDHNALERAAGSTSTYPAGNYQLATGTLASLLDPQFRYLGSQASSDGRPLGADITTLLAKQTTSSALPITPAPLPPPPIPLPTPPVVSAPYKLPGVDLTLTVQAEDVDTGGEGVAYHDLDATNNGRSYRLAEGVDLEPTTDTGGGYDLGWIQAGEWVQYTVTLPAGSYTLTLRVACLGQGGTFHVEEAGKNLTGSLTIPNTGGWQKWTTLSKALGSLPAGVHTFRIVMDTSGPNAVGNLNWFTLTGSQK